MASSKEIYPLDQESDPELPIDGNQVAQVIQGHQLRRVHLGRVIEELMPPTDPADIESDSF